MKRVLNDELPVGNISPPKKKEELIVRLSIWVTQIVSFSYSRYRIQIWISIFSCHPPFKVIAKRYVVWLFNLQIDIFILTLENKYKEISKLNYICFEPREKQSMICQAKPWNACEYEQVESTKDVLGTCQSCNTTQHMSSPKLFAKIFIKGETDQVFHCVHMETMCNKTPSKSKTCFFLRPLT